jgi:hypothetical protein
VDDELERMWKEAVLALTRYKPEFGLNDWGENPENFQSG